MNTRTPRLWSPAKNPSEVLGAIDKRLQRSWHLEVDDLGSSGLWPHAFPLGRVRTEHLDERFAEVQRWSLDWQEWAAERAHTRVVLESDRRRTGGANVPVPARLVVENVPSAALLVGNDWTSRLATAASRREALLERFLYLATTAVTPDDTDTEDRDTAETDNPDADEADVPGAPDRPVPATAALLRKTADFLDLDFAILLDVADFFLANPAAARGLTPRQVPVPGVDAKWLERKGSAVRMLTGIEDLGLLPPHPQRIHFTYLDPDYLADPTNRRHDSASVGDSMQPAYTPRVVIISENKDTAIHFPPVPGGISIEGEGRGGGAIASFDWVRHAEHLYYWGDIDADGFEILDGFIGAGLPVQPLLMDRETWERYGHLGCNRHPSGKSLTARAPRAVSHLHAEQAGMYRDLCSDEWPDFRRLEQERIPLAAAAESLRASQVVAR